jgi:GNAT superfamily N-acetyltransferase
MELQFRPATPGDAGILLPLISSAFRGDESRKGWTTEADLVAGERIDEASLLEKITAQNGVILLATDKSGALIACCELLKLKDRLGYFGLFAVNPERQGGGLGKQVLRVAESYAREKLGATRMEMSVLWMREELIAWYVRRGYVMTWEKRAFPWEILANGKEGALRDDLYFEVLEKDLAARIEVTAAA